MKLSHNIFSKFTLISAAFFLSACGGGGGSGSGSSTTPEVKPQPFQSSFTSSLTIIENPSLLIGEKKYNIQSKSSNQASPVLAYKVMTEIDNTLITEDGQGRIIKHPQANQKFSFDLVQNDISIILDIEYDQILKRATSFTLTKATGYPDQPEQTFKCQQENSNNICSGATVNYNETTGSATITFNQAEFHSINTMSNILINLNGQLKGTLSIPPQTVQNIPKASQGSVTIDGVTHQILAAFNNPEQMRVGARILNAGISVLLDNGANISFTKDDNGLYSQYINSRDFFSNAAPIDTKGLIFKDLASASQFTLQPTVFNFSNFGNEPQQQPVTISATVEAPIPQQLLSINPVPSQSPAADQNNPWYSSTSIFNRSITPDDFTIRLINHNTVVVESQDFVATIQDRKLKSLKLNSLIISPNTGSSSLTRLVFIDYQCGEGTTISCNGVTIEPNGFGVKFNNTVLTKIGTDNQSSSAPLPSSIKLNGGLVYLGR